MRSNQVKREKKLMSNFGGFSFGSLLTDSGKPDVRFRLPGSAIVEIPRELAILLPNAARPDDAIAGS
jgi:hypothetical protein